MSKAPLVVTGLWSLGRLHTQLAFSSDGFYFNDDKGRRHAQWLVLEVIYDKTTNVRLLRIGLHFFSIAFGITDGRVK